MGTLAHLYLKSKFNEAGSEHREQSVTDQSLLLKSSAYLFITPLKLPDQWRQKSPRRLRASEFGKPNPQVLSKDSSMGVDLRR